MEGVARRSGVVLAGLVVRRGDVLGRAEDVRPLPGAGARCKRFRLRRISTEGDNKDHKEVERQWKPA